MTEPEPPPNYTGLWVFDDGDGLRREIEYVNGIRTGIFRSFLSNGVIHREGHLVDGVYHGDLTTRNNLGEIIDVSTFDHGTGTYRIFMSCGQLGWRIELRYGKVHGRKERFNVRGNLIQVEHYCDGVLVQSGECSEGNGSSKQP